MSDEDESAEELTIGVDGDPAHETIADVAEIVRALQSIDSNWSEPGTEEHEYGSVHWRPHMVREGGVLHIHAASRLRPYVVARMSAARESGHDVFVALPFESLFDDDVAIELAALDAQVYVVRDGAVIPTPRHILTALADDSVPLEPESVSEIANVVWGRVEEGSSHVKGRRFEALLCFLLSQIPDFRVVKHNYRGETDELDIVVQIDAHSNRCWCESGVPFVLVEAKNWAARVDQATISAFKTKIETRGGRARIGLVVGRSGFTSDAEAQVMKFSENPITIVLIGPDQIVSWMNARNAPDYLEDVVRDAMLIN